MAVLVTARPGPRKPLSQSAVAWIRKRVMWPRIGGEGWSSRTCRSASGYRLELDREQVDAGRFARLVAERRFEEGLALWRGPPLGEFEDQHWARAEAARLEELHATAVEEHIETRLAAGEHAALVPEL
ncbi:MAG: AfsR/SARP family transcriptional regulator, partial [Gaiellaceae bacterium]